MQKLTDKKQIDATIALFTLTYMVSYMTRINLGAVITAVVEETGMTKTMLSAAVTGSAITYGVGQILSGWIGDRYTTTAKKHTCIRISQREMLKLI